MQHYILLLMILGSFAGTAPAAAQPAAGDIVIERAWARATIGQLRVGAAYVSIHNHGSTVDRLVDASSTIAGRVELHGHAMDGNVMRMRSIPSIEIPAGGGITLEPGGMHLMLMDLERPLTEGEGFPLTLRFEKAGIVDVEVEVRSPTARGGPSAVPGHEGHGGGHHHGHGHGHGPEHGQGR